MTTEPNKPSDEALAIAKIIDDGHKMVRGAFDHVASGVKGLFNKAVTEDDELRKPFRPCVIYNEAGKFTEIVLEDVATVWDSSKMGDDVGHAMDDGRLVAVRIAGDVRKKP